jgi:uncharacterized RDD family membrane protein YckC
MPQCLDMYAPFGRRIVATLIDIGVVALLILALLELLAEAPIQIKASSSAVLALLYEPYLTSSACTVGQLLTGTRVRHFQTRERIGFRAAFLRFAAKYVGTFAQARHARRDDLRANHDLLAETIVINK